MSFTKIICIAQILMSIAFSPVWADDNRWWPVQTMPKALARTANTSEYNLPYEMMAQSIAGLAAKAVNEGGFDEMVWVNTNNIDVEDWLTRLLKRNPQVEIRGTFGVWELIDRYTKKGIIKGYILYRLDNSKGEFNQHRPGMNCSVNIATSLAALLDGVIVDETIEQEAKKHGLNMLMDVRDKTQDWCFETYKDRFNRRMVCTQDPKKPNVRDLAIAQKAFTMFGYDEPAPAVMKWLQPLSPILGCNGGDEFKTTGLSSRWGHIQTATDWCNNLPVLMAGSEKTQQSKVKSFDPQAIDFNDTRSAVCFIDSDGDNVNFSEGNFFRADESQYYWANPDRGKIPFGWSCCFAHLSQLNPEAINYAISTRTPNDYFLEWGGGYYYPDLFAIERPNRWELLAKHAQRTWSIMKKNNTRIIGFNVSKIDSPDVLKAYETFANQTDGLLAILVWQYDHYEAGGGKVFWVKDQSGIEVPVISVRYLIWENKNSRARCGTPAKIAREIRQTIENTPANELPRYDWVNIHAWSWFKNSPGNDENGENMSQRNAAQNGGTRGCSPVIWCANRLPSSIRTVSPEELIWRIRMKHNAKQTQKLIQDWSR